MEGSCSTGQSPQWAVVPVEEEEDYMTTAQDGGKVVSLTHRPPLPPENVPGTSFLLEAESTPGTWCDRKDYVNEKCQ
jgi:hypothetical protein